MAPTGRPCAMEFFSRTHQTMKGFRVDHEMTPKRLECKLQLIQLNTNREREDIDGPIDGCDNEEEEEDNEDSRPNLEFVNVCQPNDTLSRAK